MAARKFNLKTHKGRWELLHDIEERLRSGKLSEKQSRNEAARLRCLAVARNLSDSDAERKEFRKLKATLDEVLKRRNQATGALLEAENAPEIPQVTSESTH